MTNPIRFGFFLIVLSLALTGAKAQSDTWDSLLSNSQWFVPADNLLAYFSSGTNLASALPVADQTIWTIGTATNGVFSGTSDATFQFVDSGSFNSTTDMNGIVTDSGQIQIVFTGSNGSKTVGVGQIQSISGTDYMEMQMITGSSSSSYISHWAYMAPYVSGSTELPPLVIPALPPDQAWAWMDDSTWEMQSNDLFGIGGVGTFRLDDYNGGYYWGSGTGPAGSPTENFTVIGSVTPEGDVLFSVLDGNSEVLTSLTGQLTGTTESGTMALRTYDPESGFGDASTAFTIPEPASVVLCGLGIVGILLAGRSRRQTSA